MSATEAYAPCRAEEIPAGVRFDVPRRNQGQMIEIAYGGFGRAEHGPGDEYMRRRDLSNGEVSFFRAARPS